MPTTPAHRRKLMRAAALAAGLSTAASLALVTSPTATARTERAAAPAIASVAISAGKSVRSSSHVPLKVATYASRSAGGSSAGTFGVSLTNGGESHSWSFPIPRSALKLNAAGKGKLVVPAKYISPFGKVKLTITPKGAPTAARCGGSTIGKSRKVVVKGTFWFDSRSGSNRWGSVGSKSKKKTFKFAVPASVVWTYAGKSGVCGGNPGTGSTCKPSSSWTGMNGTQFIFGSVNGSKDITAIRSVKFAKPANSMRSDSRRAQVKSAVLTRENDSTTGSFVVTGDGGATKGSVSVPEMTLIDQTVPCGTSNQAKMTSGFGNAVNGTTPFAVYDIFGGIGLANGSMVSTSQIQPLM